MAPRKLAAGNWKMNGTQAALAEIDQLLAAPSAPGCDVLICPPATLIQAMVGRSLGQIGVGGQDCHAKASGAHTGDIAAAQLADAGASHVILGHSERRTDHGETDAAIRAKSEAAHAAGLIAVICVGETEAQRDAGKAESVVTGQVSGSVPVNLDAVSQITVAYEPVWAIGTGRVPSVDDVSAMHRAIRARLIKLFGENGAMIRILYGGSVNAGNAAELLGADEVGGALVGGASLVAESFLAIAHAAAGPIDA